MGTVAGTSAVAAYRGARARRRRAALVTGLFLGAGLAAGYLACAVAGPGSGRLAAVVGVVACLALAAMARPRPDPERWLRGAAGEAATARVLARLPARRWAVWHDLRVPGSRANLDHLLIGPTGVWVVDTKTTRAAVRAGWRTVRVGDRILDTGPVTWEARVVADRLGVPARPLVVVHGAGLRRRGSRCGGVRVVPIEGLTRRIRRGRRRLTRAEVANLAVRTQQVFRPASASSEKRATRRG
jgi:Nuclease-related domain